MKQIPVLIFLLIIISLGAQAQGAYSVKGMVQDTMNLKPVPFASVSLIRKADSVLTRFTRTNEKGLFELKPTDAGTYLVLVAHNQYVDYVDEVILTEQQRTLYMGTLPLFQRGQLLKEVIIKNQAAIRIKGDTLEYLADSFKVRQGAMVEDLLKVMPGIQVNKKGEITAMGEKVEKVLVDGEEFFGDDPTVATQNIQSKVVEKVQVFDKKSDQAQFTGFDDGNSEKTINLKLKDNMNRGLFGKIEAGGGPQDRWNNQVMMNAFKNKRQMSVYGLMSSNGKTGLGWEDRNAYTGDGGGGMQMDEDGAFIWNSNSEDDDNNFSRGNSEGITKAWTGGARYANKWNDAKHALNSNYSFGRINQERKETSITENLYPNNRFYTYDTNTSFNSRNTHRLTTKYTWTPDSMTNIIYSLNARLSDIENETFNSTRNAYEESGLLLNRSVRKNKSQSKTGRISNNLTINRKLKKTGRTLSLTSSYVHNDNRGDGMLDGENEYYQGITRLDTLDQKKEQAQITNTLNADLSYTEPLTKKLLLKTSYGYSIDGNFSKKSTLIKNNGVNDYEKRIDSLSSDFNSVIQSHAVGAEFKWVEKKFNIALGTRVRYSMFDQKDLVRLYTYNYGRLNIFPTLRINYKFDQFSRLSFTYNGSTRQPSISQLQPVQDNTNPLSLSIGNPNLKIGYSQNINANYFNYKVISGRSIYAGFNFNNTFNNISLSRYVDELGRTISQYININGGYNGTLWGGLFAKIPKTNVNGKLNVSGNFNHTPNVINTVRSVTNTLSLTLTPGINYALDEKLYLDVDLGTVFTNTQTTIPNGRDIRFLSFTPSASLTWTLPKNFEISTDADYIYNPPVGPYATPFSRFLWNGALMYRMLDNKNLTWKLSVNDILRQNRGYDRTTTANFNQERNYMTLTRYWMLSLVWNFNDGPMAAAQQGTGGGRRMPGMPRGMRSGGRRMGR